MVHNNPRETLIKSAFNSPTFLKQQDYTGQVMNDFPFAHSAITFDKLNPQIFPKSSKERACVMAAADRVNNDIKNAHAAGIKLYYFTDIIVLSKTLVALFHDDICNANGKIYLKNPRLFRYRK